MVSGVVKTSTDQAHSHMIQSSNPHRVGDTSVINVEIHQICRSFCFNDKIWFRNDECVGVDVCGSACVGDVGLIASTMNMERCR